MGWLAFCHCFVIIGNLSDQFCHFFFNSFVAFVVVVAGVFLGGEGVKVVCLFLLCFFNLAILNKDFILGCS